MARMDQRSARLVACGMLGFVLFSPPLLTIFNRSDRVLGVPLLWAYLLLAWTVVIALIAVAVRKVG